jgi:hypothetical protein
MLRESLRTCRRWLAEQDGRSGRFGVSMVAQEPGSPADACHPVRRVAVLPRRPPIAIRFGTSGCAARCLGSGSPVFEQESAARHRRGTSTIIWDVGVRGPPTQFVSSCLCHISRGLSVSSRHFPGKFFRKFFRFHHRALHAEGPAATALVPSPTGIPSDAAPDPGSSAGRPPGSETAARRPSSPAASAAALARTANMSHWRVLPACRSSSHEALRSIVWC